MSAVFLNVGQCGNQLSQAFWQEMEEWTARNSKLNAARARSSLGGSATSRGKAHVQSTGRASAGFSAATSGTMLSKKLSYLSYSLLNGTLPCLYVDTEPKVIKSLRSNPSSTINKRISPECTLILPEGCGRGSNWAYGYNGKVARESKSEFPLSGKDEGRVTVKSVEEKMRKMVEKCDRFGGTVLMHSLAGGTGSGLSSVLLETIRDSYPLAYILSIPIVPFSLGDTPLQHYNSLFCLSWLQTYSDAVLLIQNDVILNQAQHLLLDSKGSGGGGGSTRGKGGRESVLQDGPVSLADMNKRISQVLCNSFMPIWSAKQSSPSYACQEPWELVRSLCPDPKLKFITPFHTESSRYSWDPPTAYLLNPLLVRRKPTLSGESVKTSSLSLILIARGSPNSINNSLMKGTNLTSLEGKLKDVYSTVKWNPFPVDFWLSHEVQLVDRKFATVLVNGSIVCDYLEAVVRQASVMYKERAYLHWYERYGCEDDNFKEAFDATQTIVDNYTLLK